MTNENTTADSIVSQALKDAGVPEANINLTPTPSQTVAADKAVVPRLDGELKGPTKDTEFSAEIDKIFAAKEPVGPDGKPPEGADGDKVVALGKEEMSQMLTETLGKFQSLVDRKINQLQQQQTATVNALNSLISTQEQAVLEGLPEDVQLKRRLEKLEKGEGSQVVTTQPVSQQLPQFYNYLVSFVTAVGLDPADKRIDWAPDEDDPNTGLNKFLTSIKNAVSEDKQKEIGDLKAEATKAVTKLAKRLGVDKIPTSPPSGDGLPDMSKLSPMEKIELGLKIVAEQKQISQ